MKPQLSFTQNSGQCLLKKHTLFQISVLSVIFFSGGVQYFNIFVSTLIPTLIITWLYYYEKIGISKLLIRPSLILLLYFSYAFLISHDSEDLTFIWYRLVRFVMALSILNYITYKKVDIVDELYQVLKILLIHGILNFIISNLFFQFFSPNPETNTSNLLFFFSNETNDYFIRRNQGIFWEPGVFQIFLNLFLFINLFYREKRFPIWIILSVIFTTLSTTGIVISFFQILIFTHNKTKYHFKRLIPILLLLPVLIVFFLFTKHVVQDKFTGENRGSFFARSFDTINGFNIALNNPWGIGFSTIKYQNIARNNTFNIDALVDTDRAQTNSIATLFYSTGIIWGIIFLFFTYKQNLFIKKKLALFIIIIVCLSSEPLFFSVFFLIFPISGMIKHK